MSETGQKTLRIAVVGAHLTGMPLNHQLTSRGSTFVRRDRTSADYHLFALSETSPPKPGLSRGTGGSPIEIELWDMPLEKVGSFLDEIPSPLGLGTVVLADGSSIKGFICESYALDNAEDITSFGGWKAYVLRNGVG